MTPGSLPRRAMLEWQLPGLSGDASAVAVAGFRSLLRAPETRMMLLTPAAVLVTMLLCFTYLGDGLRDALDPKDR